MYGGSAQAVLIGWVWVSPT